MTSSLFASIPSDVRNQIAGRLATEVGFGAGPGCVAVNIRTLDPPVSLEVALSWLEGYRSVFRRGHVELADGTRLFFDPNGFLRVAPKAATDANA